MTTAIILLTASTPRF